MKYTEVLQSIDKSIFSLLEQRDKIAREYYASLNQDFNNYKKINPELFYKKFIKENDIKVQAGVDFIDGYRIDYEPNELTDIRMSQIENENTILAPADHLYRFNLKIVNPGKTKWISLNERLGVFDVQDYFYINMFLKIKAPKDCKLVAGLFFPQLSKTEVIKVKQIHIPDSDNYYGVSINEKIVMDEKTKHLDIKRSEARLLLFFPNNRIGEYSLAMFSTMMNQSVAS